MEPPQSVLKLLVKVEFVTIISIEPYKDIPPPANGQ